MKFMLMTSAAKGEGDWNMSKWPPKDVQAMVRYMKGLNAELSAAGELVEAQGLAMPSQAKFVRAGAAGKPEITDGPFAESKEFLAGFWIIDVETPEQAYAIAARASAAPGIGGVPMNAPIEVRQVMSAPAD